MRIRALMLFCTLVLIALVFLALGCGSSNKAKIRLVNASPDESALNLLVDSNSAASNISFGTASAYASVSSGSHHLQVEPAGATTPIIDTTASVSSGSYSTLISLNYSSNITSAILTDDNSVPGPGNIKLRIVNASPGLGAQDVYVEAPGTNIVSVSPTFSSLAFGSASAYSLLPSGSYEVYFTAPGQKFINLDSGPLSFSASQIRTLLALNSPSGGYTSTVLSDLN